MLDKYNAQATKELQALVDSAKYNPTTFDATIEELIVKRHADPNVSTPIDGITSAMMAAAGGHTQALELLIKAGAKLDIQDKDGITAVMFAAMEGHTQALEFLIKAGAKVDTQDQDGITSAMMAAAGGHTQALELLIKARAQLDIQNKDGITAVTLAAMEDHTQALEFLIKAGADLSLKTEGGNTALDCAIMYSMAGAISVLVGKEVVGQKAMEACGAPKKAGLFASSSYKADDLRTLAALKLDDKPLSEVLGHIAAKHKGDLQKAYTSYLTSGKEVDDKVAKMVETALNTKYEKTKGSKEAEMGGLNLQANPMEAKHKHGSSISSARLSAEDKLSGGAPQTNNPMAAKSVNAAGQAVAKDGATKAVAVDNKLVASLLKGFKKTSQR
jgi:hypothetical protein